MKSTPRIFAIFLIVVLGVYAGGRFLTAEQAASNCPEIQNCLAEGYWVETCEEQPYYYLISPEGNYEWGTVQTRLNCDQTTGAGEPPLVVTCYIEARNKRGRTTFTETHNHVQPIK